MTNEYDDFDSNQEIDYKPLDLNTVKEKAPTFSSQKLCEMIVCDRYFGCFNEIAIICMEELSKRRQAGDDFVYETYINEAFKQLPSLNTGSVNLRDILQQAISRKANK
jgi:hypothetical protein